VVTRLSPVAATFGLAAAAAVTTGLGAYWNGRALADATAWVAHTREVQGSLEQVLSLLKDAETGQRGFLLTSDPAMLAPYVMARQQLPASLDHLQRLTADNPRQQERIAPLRETVNGRLQLATDSVDRLRAGDRAGALQPVVAGRGRAVMDDARAEVARMQQEEERLLRERLRDVERTQARGSLSAVLTTALLLALLGTVYLSADRSQRRVRHALAGSETARRELEFTQRGLDRAAGVVVLDANGAVVHVNEEFSRLSGYAPQDLVGRDHTLLAPQFGARFYDDMARGQTWRGELASRTRDGEPFWTDTTVVPLMDERGRPERFIAIHHEITARKQAELALRESESRYRTLTEALPHMVWTATPSFRPTYFSGHWQAFTGMDTASTPDFESWSQLIHPDDRAAFLAHVEVPMTRGEAHEAEFRLRGKDGVYRRVVARTTPRRDEDGRLVQWVGTVTDIEDRWRAEQALRESQALVQAIVEGSSALVFAKDLQGRYFLTNAAWRRIAGVSEERARGITDREVFGESVAAQLRAADARVATSGEPVLVEESAIVRGNPVTYLSSKFPLRNEAGEVYAVCGVSTDVTELKAAREEVQRLARDLERRVEERTRELSVANEELEAFSYTVSHDLRAPLRGMQGFAQAVQEDYAAQLDEDGREYLDRIIRAARRMESLIQDLLDYSRLSRGQVQLRPASLQMAVDEALQQLAEDIARSRAQLHVERPLPAVQAHPTLLVQVVSNLLGNALKFAQPGEPPQVHVRSQQQDGRVRVEVRDEGIGIDPEHQDRIFRVFERLHGQEAYAGTGVGLAIVRRACERMGGRCGVRSQPGAGSTFWFELQAAMRGTEVPA
jgi:PAS domain S-box-containing protein